MMRAAVDASSHSAAGADTNETLMLTIAALTEEVARGQSTEKENLYIFLKEAFMAKDKEISALQKTTAAAVKELKEALTAKDEEISDLQATAAFLEKRCDTLANLAQSAAVPAEAGSQLSPVIQNKGEIQQSKYFESQNRNRVFSRVFFDGLRAIQQESVAANSSRAFSEGLGEMQRDSDAASQRLKDAGATPEEIRAKMRGMRAAEESLLLAMAASDRSQPKANAAENSSHPDL